MSADNIYPVEQIGWRRKARRLLNNLQAGSCTREIPGQPTTKPCGCPWHSSLFKASLGRFRIAAIAVVLVTAACSSSTTTTTAPTATGTGAPEPPSTAVATTVPLVTVDASFAIGTVVFGEQGWIELVNTGPQAGNIHGHWIAIHPYYLEMPSAIVEVGQGVRVSLDPSTASESLVVAANLLPELAASGGEVGLYSNGSFGDPDAIVDYVEWGSGGHFRSTVAMAAGIWDETRIVPMVGNEGGLVVLNGPVLLDADLAPPSDGG